MGSRWELAFVNYVGSGVPGAEGRLVRDAVGANPEDEDAAGRLNRRDERAGFGRTACDLGPGCEGGGFGACGGADGAVVAGYEDCVGRLIVSICLLES